MTTQSTTTKEALEPCHICGGVNGEHVYEMHREGFVAPAPASTVAPQQSDVIHWRLRSGTEETMCGLEVTAQITTTLLHDGATCEKCQAAVLGYKLGRADGRAAPASPAALRDEADKLWDEMGARIHNDALAYHHATHVAPNNPAKFEECPERSCVERYDLLKRIWAADASIAAVPASSPTFRTTKEAVLYAQRYGIPTVIPATTPPSTLAKAAASKIASYLFANIFHPARQGGISESQEAEIAAIIERCLAGGGESE